MMQYIAFAIYRDTKRSSLVLTMWPRYWPCGSGIDPVAPLLTLWPQYWPCGPSTGPLCYSGSFGLGAGFEAFWSSINVSNTLCTTPGCKTNPNFLLQAAQGFMACLYYDAYTAPMLVKVISLQFLPLQHHNYSIQSTNLYPQNTGWLLVSKRVSNCTARRRVAVYHLSLLKLLLRSINTSLSHIGDIGKKKTSITSTATTF